MFHEKLPPKLNKRGIFCKDCNLLKSVFFSAKEMPKPMLTLSLFRNFQNKRQNSTIFYSGHRTLTQPLHLSGKNRILSPAPSFT